MSPLKWSGGRSGSHGVEHYLNITDLGALDSAMSEGETDHDAGGFLDVIDATTDTVILTSKALEDGASWADALPRMSAGWSDDCVSSSPFSCVLRIPVDSTCSCGTCAASSGPICSSVALNGSAEPCVNASRGCSYVQAVEEAVAPHACTVRPNVSDVEEQTCTSWGSWKRAPAPPPPPLPR